MEVATASSGSAVPDSLLLYIKFVLYSFLFTLSAFVFFIVLKLKLLSWFSLLCVLFLQYSYDEFEGVELLK